MVKEEGLMGEERDDLKQGWGDDLRCSLVALAPLKHALRNDLWRKWPFSTFSTNCLPNHPASGRPFLVLDANHLMAWLDPNKNTMLTLL